MGLVAGEDFFRDLARVFRSLDRCAPVVEVFLQLLVIDPNKPLTGLHNIIFGDGNIDDKPVG